MTSRERMLAAIRHEPVDRIPTDIWATPEVWKALSEAFGPDTNFREALHIDGVCPVFPARYIGPDLPSTPENETVDFWGIRRKQVSNESGSYEEQCFAPLEQAVTLADIEAYSWPRADWFEYCAPGDEIVKAHESRLTMCDEAYRYGGEKSE